MICVRQVLRIYNTKTNIKTKTKCILKERPRPTDKWAVKDILQVFVYELLTVCVNCTSITQYVKVVLKKEVTKLRSTVKNPQAEICE